MKTTAAVLANADDTFEYATGNPEFRGRTTVRVSGDGKAEASLERAGKTERYTGTVPPAQLKKLRGALTSHPIDTFKAPARNPVPDETTIELTVVTGGQQTKNSILSGETAKNEALEDLVDIVQTIASKVSGGKIQY